MELRIRELRNERDISAKELGKICGVSEAAMTNYELHKREANYVTLIKLASFFDVTVGYLLGLDESNVVVVKSSSDPLEQDEKELLDSYHSLDAEGQQELINYIGYLKTKHTKNSFFAPKTQLG